VVLESTRRPGDGKGVWQKCEGRGCDYCGPAIREQDLAHDLGNLVRSGRPVVRRVVVDDDATWKRLRAKIKRAADREGVEGGWTAYPQAGGMLAVFAVVGMTGALVTDLADELASDYGGIPPNGRIRRPRCWSLHKAPAKGSGEKAYRPVGATIKTDQVPDILRRLGCYRGEVDEGAVPGTAWEAHNLMVPPRHTREFDRFVDALGLELGRSKPAAKEAQAAARRATAKRQKARRTA
jgi:hypothetical protein